MNTILLTSTQNDSNIVIVETTLEPGIHFIPICIFAIGVSTVVGLCILLAGVIICCVCKLALHWRSENLLVCQYLKKNTMNTKYILNEAHSCETLGAVV